MGWSAAAKRNSTAAEKTCGPDQTKHQPHLPGVRRDDTYITGCEVTPLQHLLEQLQHSCHLGEVEVAAPCSCHTGRYIAHQHTIHRLQGAVAAAAHGVPGGVLLCATPCCAAPWLPTDTAPAAAVPAAVAAAWTRIYVGDALWTITLYKQDRYLHRQLAHFRHTASCMVTRRQHTHDRRKQPCSRELPRQQGWHCKLQGGTKLRSGPKHAGRSKGAARCQPGTQRTSCKHPACMNGAYLGVPPGQSAWGRPVCRCWGADQPTSVEGLIGPAADACRGQHRHATQLSRVLCMHHVNSCRCCQATWPANCRHMSWLHSRLCGALFLLRTIRLGAPRAV